jgi:hypothetical protein
MEKNDTKFNRKQPDKRVSDTGRVQRNSVRHRMSLAKSIGKLKKGEQDTPIVAIQQVHLLRKQKAFLTKQAFVFQKKAEAVREQVKMLEDKIKSKKELAMDLVKSMESENEAKIEEKQLIHKSKPDKTMSQKAKKIFRLKY